MKIGFTVLVLLLYFIVVKPVSADSDLCQTPGNNLIDNISPNVLVNLRKDAGNPNCWLTGTFLFRPNDLSSPNLANFFRAAAENRIYPIIRVGGENSGHDWPAITPNEAMSAANYLNQAAAGFPKSVYVKLGNEVNANKEWGGRSDPASYADSFIAFVQNSGSLKVFLPPLILNDATSISVENYYRELKKSLDQKLAGNFRCNLTDELCREKIDEWFNEHISGYGLNLYASAGNTSAIINDKNRAVNALKAAGFVVDGKKFIITEIGLPGGVYSANVGAEACKFYQALKADGPDFLAATIYSRDSQDRVHAFYYTSGNCAASREYRVAVINLGGSVTYGPDSGYPSENKIVYPPLGSLETCPTAVNTNSTSCSPVGSLGKCNSECSPPIEIEQNLQLLGTGGCAISGNCSAQIKILGNKIPVPGQIKELADYFETVVPYFLSASQQDDLRCQFIEYVKNTPNSKYKDMKIDGKLITSLPCSPKEVSGWSKIPLFPNDDAQGKIEFVSPSLATIQPINVSIPQIQRLNSATKILQSALVPAQPSQPKTYGDAITINLESNSCQKTPTWQEVYGADYDRAVACDFGNLSAVSGKNNLSGCVLLPDGTLQCERTEAASGFRRVTGQEATVQVRTVFPHLYETSDQTISFLQGVLQIFRPELNEDFKKPYYGVPAAVGGVKYELTESSGLAINDAGHKQTGWQLFFYNIGGLWNARDFVLNMLNKQ